MASSIYKVTVVCQQGTKSYCIDKEVNGMKIHHIGDRSVEYPDALHVIYAGYTKENDKVFETYNAPVEVEYYQP